jgi:microsomal dipeptidase-like Zn-dependent dipeptidase
VSQGLFETLRRHGYDDRLLSKIAMDHWFNCLTRTLQ